MKTIAELLAAKIITKEQAKSYETALAGHSEQMVQNVIKVIITASKKAKLVVISPTSDNINSASIGSNSMDTEIVNFSVKPTVNMLATRLVGENLNVEAIIMDLASQETVRSVSAAYVAKTAARLGLNTNEFLRFVNAYGGTYKAVSKLRTKGDSWAEGQNYNTTHYADERVTIQLSRAGVDAAINYVAGKASTAEPKETTADALDNVVAADSDFGFNN